MSEETKKNVLVIEDDEVLGDVIVQKLNNSGYVATLERDGKTGYARIQSDKPDLVLLDIMLPSMNGYEILEDKQKEETIAGIPVIIISNSGQPVEISRAIALGVKDYLVKANFTPEEVLKKVSEQFGKQPGNGDAGTQGGALKDKRVLVVEDETFLKDLLSMKFSKEGAALLHATDGQEAIDMAKEEKPHIILLDLVLPSMSGFDVIQKLKADQETASIPVIVLSNLGQESDIARGKELGAAEFLVKANFSLDEVVEKVRNILATAVT